MVFAVSCSVAAFCVIAGICLMSVLFKDKWWNSGRYYIHAVLLMLFREQ